MPPPQDYADWSPPTDDTSGRHHVPFVRLTSSSEYVSSPEAETRTSTRPGSVWTLYTITELTERSETSRHGDHLQAQLRNSNTTHGTSITSDYGQVLG